MKARRPSLLILACAAGFALAASLACAQAAPTPQAPGGGYGQRGNRGGGGMMGMGRGTAGTVTEVAADHYTIRTELGEIYTVHFSVNTRIVKQPPPRPHTQGQRQDQGDEGERTPPQPIKPTDIKVGDVIAAGGEVDTNAKSIGAVFVMLVDPERAKEMRAMEANYGKTWLMGRVSAINEVKVTLQGGPKNETRTFVADENTTFRKRRDPITLGDIQVGDMVRVEGAVKDGAFLATAVAVMGPPPEGAPDRGANPGQPTATPPQ
jgi:hypothetical protein